MSHKSDMIVVYSEKVGNQNLKIRCLGVTKPPQAIEKMVQNSAFRHLNYIKRSCIFKEILLILPHKTLKASEQELPANGT
jgi:hypothetical protein